MMKNELEQSLEITLSQIEELKKKAEKIIEELKKEEIPLYPEFEKGSVFSYVDTDLSVQTTGAVITETTQDYNAFHSEYYAKLLAERSNYLAMLLHCKWYFDRDYEPDWNNPNEIKWTVGFNHEADIFRIYEWAVADFGTIAFGSKEAAQKVCDWLNSNGKGITI